MTMLPILLAAAMAFPDGKRCAVTYTFDDGLADQYEVAFPMFRNAGLQATFFPITDKVGDPKGLKSKAERGTPLMTWAQLKEMSDAGMEIGTHGASHGKYSKMTRQEMLADMRRGKDAVEREIGRRCGSFASPFNAKRGVDGTSVEEAAREAGFSAMRMFQKAAGGAMTAEKMNALVEAARKKGDWLVFMSHGMKRGYDAWESPEELKKHLEWVKAQPDVWVGTFGEVAAWRAAHPAATSSADEIAKYEAVAGLPRDPNEKTVEPPKGMKLFLLMGQSNMAGRAKPSDADRTPAPNAYKMNRDDKWSPATPPLHYDKTVAGYGPADAFIRAYLAEHPGEAVGVIPCAVGGSSIKLWGNGANHLEVAVRRLKAALPHGELVGVLWHQGETDALKMKEERYRGLFAEMVGRIRKEAGSDVPIVVGEIGRFMAAESERINPIIAACAAVTPKCACVSSEGLKNQDKFHFDRASAEELGRRYYKAWKGIAK